MSESVAQTETAPTPKDLLPPVSPGFRAVTHDEEDKKEKQTSPGSEQQKKILKAKYELLMQFKELFDTEVIYEIGIKKIADIDVDSLGLSSAEKIKFSFFKNPYSNINEDQAKNPLDYACIQENLSKNNHLDTVKKTKIKNWHLYTLSSEQKEIETILEKHEINCPALVKIKDNYYAVRNSIESSPNFGDKKKYIAQLINDENDKNLIIKLDFPKDLFLEKKLLSSEISKNKDLQNLLSGYHTSLGVKDSVIRNQYSILSKDGLPPQYASALFSTKNFNKLDKKEQDFILDYKNQLGKIKPEEIRLIIEEIITWIKRKNWDPIYESIANQTEFQNFFNKNDILVKIDKEIKKNCKSDMDDCSLFSLCMYPTQRVGRYKMFLEVMLSSLKDLDDVSYSKLKPKVDDCIEHLGKVNGVIQKSLRTVDAEILCPFSSDQQKIDKDIKITVRDELVDRSKDQDKANNVFIRQKNRAIDEIKKNKSKYLDFGQKKDSTNENSESENYSCSYESFDKIPDLTELNKKFENSDSKYKIPLIFSDKKSNEFYIFGYWEGSKKITPLNKLGLIRINGQSKNVGDLIKERILSESKDAKPIESMEISADLGKYFVEKKIHIHPEEEIRRTAKHIQGLERLDGCIQINNQVCDRANRIRKSNASSAKGKAIAEYVMSELSAEIPHWKRLLQSRKARGVFWSTVGISGGIAAMEALAPHWSYAQVGAHALSHFFNQLLPNLLTGDFGAGAAVGGWAGTIAIGLVALVALGVSLGYGFKKVQETETYQNCFGGEPQKYQGG